MRHRASSTRLVVVAVPTGSGNTGWVKRPKPEKCPTHYPDKLPNPPQPIPSREAREALNEAKRIISQRKAVELWQWLERRTGQ
jgi:hypothetical protein